MHEEAYRAGRSAVLQPFADRDIVYRPGMPAASGNEQARVNLSRELARLRG